MNFFFFDLEPRRLSRTFHIVSRSDCFAGFTSKVDDEPCEAVSRVLPGPPDPDVVDEDDEVSEEMDVEDDTDSAGDEIWLSLELWADLGFKAPRISKVFLIMESFTKASTGESVEKLGAEFTSRSHSFRLPSIRISNPSK